MESRVRTPGVLPAADPAHGIFLRIEKFAVQAPTGRNFNIYEVAREAERVPENCPHVRAPAPPRLVYGVKPTEAAEVAARYGATLVGWHRPDPNGPRRQRKARSDTPVALVGVISAPEKTHKNNQWADFAASSLAWLQKKYGHLLRSVIEHLDEGCPHLHFWVVPEAGQPFFTVHDGEAAKRNVGPSATKLNRDAAYKIAMAGMLENFWLSVGCRFGLQRSTVKKKRLNYWEWRMHGAIEKELARRQAKERRKKQLREEADAARREAAAVLKQIAEHTAEEKRLSEASADAAQRQAQEPIAESQRSPEPELPRSDRDEEAASTPSAPAKARYRP